LLALFLGGTIPLAGQVHLRPGVTIRSLELTAARDSNDPTALYDLALGYWSKKRWDDVERTLDAALSIEPRNAPALMALAHLPFARRPKLWEEEDEGNVPPEWQPALIRRDRLVRLAFLVDPLVDLQIVGAIAPNESSLLRGSSGATLAQTASVGLATFRNGQYDQAYAWFDRFARLLGDGTDSARVPGFVYYYRGLAAAHLNDYPTAIHDFRLLYTIKQGDDIGNFGIDPVLDTYILAWLEGHQGALDSAVTFYQEALSLDLGLWMAHVQLARIHDDRGEWTDALSERRLAVESDPDDPSLLLDLGITLVKSGRAEEALATLRQSEAKLPRNFRVAYFEGLASQQLGQTDLAREAFRRFLAIVPSRYASEIEEVRGRLRELH
jgi:tetratricopeptide (TPR) repeat protein